MRSHRISPSRAFLAWLLVLLFLAPGKAHGDPNSPNRAFTLTPQAYLPSTAAYHATGIWGRVTASGVPVQGVYIHLGLWDGMQGLGGWRTMTDAWGIYQFQGMPGLVGSQEYYVGYANGGEGNAVNPNYLGAWTNPVIRTYAAGSTVHGGSLDLLNVYLLSPVNGETLQLPATLVWTKRPATPSDRYVVHLDGPANVSPPEWRWDSAPLPYVSELTLPAVPPGVQPGVRGWWTVEVLAPDGGVGYAYQWCTLVLGSAGSIQTEPTAPQGWPDLCSLTTARLAAANASNTPGASK